MITLVVSIIIVCIILQISKRTNNYSVNTLHPRTVSLRLLPTEENQIVDQKAESFVDIPILISIFDSEKASSQFYIPPPLGLEQQLDGWYVDFGNLDIFFLEEDGVARVIYHDSWEDEGSVHDPSKKDDDIDQYYAFDDDFTRSSYNAYDDPTLRYTNRCRRASWHRLHFPTCNTFHEIGPTTNVPRYLSHGAYGDIFLHDHATLNKKETVVWKQIIFGKDLSFTYDTYEFVRMDALISERLTYSPRIVDIYGHCGLSMLTEYFSSGDLEPVVVPTGGYTQQEQLNDKYSVRPQNALRAVDKVLVSLEMAEAIALLHGFPEGVIVHDDIQVSQFLFTPDGFIKLNDFNRAEIMLYDEEKQEYCRYRNGKGNGNYRSPEEYANRPLNEKIDIYSFGNNMYALLTGLWPFYDLKQHDKDDKEAKERLRKGEKPYIDPRYRTRSELEGFLVELIEKCWAFNPDDRPTIFELLVVLRETGRKIIEQAQKDDTKKSITGNAHSKEQGES
eukprot:CAMPEP_0202458468 /NCGR_PEP_ID=MMETSP1360-20130828/25669_1 /ASSEMBLY_ACC=CAM_ASM_000848 /TAXON_ID=515479 /ORGANISM="Licmophora paradoxa, Strain CCMP2313" /LENGTH=503 /DNA_ID=CAMNT_0049079031 /DNA_START=636 /DNA_END=2147 /DNA_ORIENTATION=-